MAQRSPQQGNEQEEEEEEAEQNNESPHSLSSFDWVKVCRLLFVVTFIVGAIYYYQEIIASKIQTTSIPSSVVCFQDSRPMKDDHDDDGQASMVVESCRNVPVAFWKPCPEEDGAVCVGGAIVQCGRHLTLNTTTTTTNGPTNSCALSLHATETIQSMKDLLHTWSVDDACRPGVTPYAIGRTDQGRPLFHYSQLVGELATGFDVALLDLANDVKYSANSKPVFVWDRQSDGNIRIGLHPAQELKLSPRCNVTRFFRFIQRTIMDIVIAIMSSIFACCMVVLAGFVDFFKETPLLNSICSGLGLVVVVVWKRRLAKQYIHRHSEIVRHHVLQLLQSEEQPPTLAVIYVRDGILDSRDLPYGAIRKRFVQEIWPAVVTKMNRDNRVLKAKTNWDGLTRDTWQWKDEAPRSAVHATNRVDQQ